MVEGVEDHFPFVRFVCLKYGSNEGKVCVKPKFGSGITVSLLFVVGSFSLFLVGSRSETC